jgi:hypothetical protein
MPGDIFDAEVPPVPDAAVETPADRIVHFQVNIEWTVEDMGETTFHRRIREKSRLPDIISAQELWPKPLCGRSNALGQEARLEAQSCKRDDYGRNSFMGILERQTGREYDVSYVADHANAVIWDTARFSQVLDSQWRFGQTEALRAACCPSRVDSGCATRDMIGVAILLRDNRLTESPDDDVLVGVASVHTGGFAGQCIAEHLRHADMLFDRWETNRATEIPLGRRFISGDLNKRPDTRSSTAAAQRREESPNCWWRGFTRNHSCGGHRGEYFDAVWSKHHDGGTGPRASICSQWTFPMNTDGADRCDVIADSAGQRYQRIDYTFVGGAMLRPRLIRSHVDKGYFDANGNGRFDFGEAYSDSHRGIYTEVDYDTL